MYNPAMAPGMGMPPVQTVQATQQLTVELDPLTYQFNKNQINGLFFGHMDSSVRAMVDEINVITAAIREESRKLMCCTFFFLCFPCLLCIYIIPKSAQLNREFKEKTEAVIAKNKQSLEGAGFTCSMITQMVHHHKGHHMQYRLEFQRYINMGMVQPNPMPNYGGGYPQAYQPGPQAYP